MTEKRFKLIGDSNIEFLLQDKLLLPIYDNGKRLSLKNTLDWLNELAEENKQLKKENKELRSDRTYWKTLSQSLAKTNGKR